MDGVVIISLAGQTLKTWQTSLEQTHESAVWINRKRFADARRQLGKTSTLVQGWDAHEAEPPNAVSRAAASSILDGLEEASLPPARLTPSAEGGIAISFVEGEKRAIIEVYNTGEIAAATYAPEGEPDVWEFDGTGSALQAAINQIRVYLAA